VDSDPKDANTPAAREILSYFLSHPDSADSLIEVARWRLMQEQVRHSVETTMNALQWLLDEGYVREEKRLGTDRLFQLNTANREAAEAFVQDDAEKRRRESERG
jgi:hypothetical protein